MSRIEPITIDAADNAHPKPFAWTKSPGEFLEKVARAKQASESQH